jgi:hypothetical protein
MIRHIPLRRAGRFQPRRSSIPRTGKKTREWNAALRKLKIAFERAGITKCEHCGSTFALSFAHSHKRRDIPQGSPLLYEVALLCFLTNDYREACHSEAESKGRGMAAFIRGIIDKRENPIILP